MRGLSLVLVLVGTIVIGAPAHAQTSEPSADSLGTHPYGSMEMLLEKTFLQLDVVRVRVEFSRDVGRHFQELSEGRRYSSVLADSVAAVALRAPRIRVGVEYQRSVSLDRYLEAVRTNLRAARDAGIIEADAYRSIADSLDAWYAPLADRGFRRGDLLEYRIEGDTVNVEVTGPEGETLYTHRQIGPRGRLGILGGYFAPGTDFREPLVRSLLRPGDS